MIHKKNKTLQEVHNQQVQNKYVYYGLARLINKTNNYLDNPSDPWNLHQLQVYLEYATKLLRRNDYGIKNGQ